MAAQTPKDVLKFAKDNKVEAVDLKFLDFLGIWQHFSMPTSELNEDLFEEGSGFDGSSIRGWQPIHASDMLVVPDPTTAVIDPFMALPTLSLICNIVDPITKESYSRDPRNIARKAEAYLKSTGIGDVAYIGPEPEFFIFDEVRYEQNQHTGYYMIDSSEGQWNTGRHLDRANDRSGKVVETLNLGYKPRYKEGYFPVAPTDTQQDIRGEMCREMEKVGMRIEKHHHEVATAQHELGIKFAELISAADNVMIYKYVVRNIARKYGKTATFMPKPVFADNGSGMHVHQSLWKAGQPLFYGEGTYANLSQTARWYIGGLLRHAPSFLAFTNPTTNSYKRLVPGFEAPVNLVYSQGNRSAAVRIPLTGPNPKAKRLEFRSGDALANPYIAFSAMLMAGIDGIRNQIDPGDGMDVDLFELSAEELAKISTVPASLNGALEALDADKAYLMAGGVFSEDFIANWIALKYEEVQQLRQRPHPHEFTMYYDA